MTTAVRASPEPSAASLAVRDAVREAAAARRPLRIVGGGGWLDAGRPVVQGAHALSIGDDEGIVDYVPGDLTLTARAGTRLSTVAQVTGAERQWLALDPFGSPDGTVGATVATASHGPLAHLFGGPRDNVIGLEFVTGAGLVARGGGRVVKNVAGFDLTRLQTGAWGTLGIITEVSFRLRALPDRDETIAVAMPDEPDALAELLERARILPSAPWALELLDGTLSQRLGLGAGSTLLVRLGGNASVVAAQRETFAGIADTRNADAAVWARLREAEPAGAVVFRLSDQPSRLGGTWHAATRCIRPFPGAFAHATVGRGTVRCIIPHEGVEPLASDSRLPSLEAHPVARALGVTSPAPGRIFERLPAHLWPVLAPPSAVDRLSRAIRDRYDPHRILNTGILGECDS